ncbi:MAG: ABC transporter substrate-binding protein [Clostridiales Family XIII bacterium]|jgi:peptide/nickel transport system substrate-binding protein|nr:ABC transporter substrate-binding protein [Clostridiales Family XIII bacterium]
MKRLTMKMIGMLLICLMVVTLASCGGSGSGDTGDAASTGETAAGETATGDTQAARDTLNIGVFLDTGTLDPLFMTGKGGYLSVQRTYCEPLWDYDLETGERFWVLATAFDPVEGSDVHYTMKVREGVTFSNGNPLTAEDILFTIKLNAADSRAFLNVKVFDVEKTTVVDDYTLDVWYTAYDPSQEPGIVQMQIVDAESYDQATYSDNPVGTGAYAVTDYVVNSHVTVERRDDYWGEKPSIKTINFKCLGELSQRVNAIETGDVDFTLVTTADIDYIESLGTAKTEISNVGSSLIAQYNMGATSPLNSVAAREAVSYAINRQSISDIAYNGHAKVIDWGASESLQEIQDRYMNMSELYTDSYNVEKAKQLAEESGLVGKSLRIVTNGDANYITAAEVIQNGLEAIGVKAEIINYDQASYFSFLMSENEYDIAINTPVAPSNLPADVFGNYPVFIPQDWSGPDREEYLALATRMNATYDQTARMDLAYELLQLFNKHVLWYGLCEDPLVYAYSNEIKNIKHTVSGLTLYQEITF